MSSLSSAFRAIPREFGLERSEAEYRFIEELTFSSADDIVRFLEEIISNDFLEIPVWVRNLAFRIACLQRPTDAALLRKAAADLECFGPDWDRIVTELRSQAAAVERAER